MLPPDPTLNVAALSRLFSSVTNSYKFIFFISLLDILKRRSFNVEEPINFREMTVEMLANAWYPHGYFRLSFGLQDRITSKLDSLNLQISTPIFNFRDTDKKLLRQTIAQQELDDSLLFYVPYRLLSPFFEIELRGMADYKANTTIAQLAEKHFNDRKPLYRFGPHLDRLLPHPEWVEYLKTHYQIVRGWTAWNWLEYMQKCNQGVPAVSTKLFPPPGRDSLIRQKSYWREVLKHGPLTCIYSGLPLNHERVSLDHYLPWSFVAHDHLWNLIPTVAEVNSSKSDRLPASIYFERFVLAQHNGLIVSNQKMAARKWEVFIEPFIADLKVSQASDLLDLTKLQQAYRSTVLPLRELAQTLGFSPNWIYQDSNR